MIVSHEDLIGLRGAVAMVDGGFDPVHGGHLDYFETAARLGHPLLVNMRGDDYLNDVKHRANLLPQEQRARLLDSLTAISYVHVCGSSTADVLRQLRPAMYVKGSDWMGRLPEEEKEVCTTHGIEIVHLDTVVDSSTQVLDRFLRKNQQLTGRRRVAEFEEMVLGQRPVEAGAYNADYFTGEWREGGEDYSIDKRREIEGRNPQNIQEVFDAKRVLDVGCGPGALMLFLHELGVEVHGIDFSESAKQMASDAIRDAIVVGPVDEYHDFGMEFDVVISRETLEHLTVLQVRRAVEVLARYTTRYLYVTTRYHPTPLDFLDVSDDKATDPTHITVLNKEFLRALFVLEGLRSRPDLEERIDWRGYGRVLVLERPRD